MAAVTRIMLLFRLPQLQQAPKKLIDAVTGYPSAIPPFPKALVFDWDNTLVDSWEAIAEAMNSMRQKMGYPVWSMDEIKHNCTRAARESFPEWFGDAWERAYQIYYHDFDEVRRKRTVKIRSGSHELLLWLKTHNIPAFVVSNKRGDYLRIEAQKVGWTDLFVSIAGAQDAPKDKPNREHVDFALGHCGLTSDASVWFVGDSETDMLCARNADCTPVFIGTPQEAARFSVPLSFEDCGGLRDLLSSYLNH